MPTPHGVISVGWKRDKHFTLKLAVPHGLTARVMLPALDGSSEVRVDGVQVKAHREGQWWTLVKDLSGNATIEER